MEKDSFRSQLRSKLGLPHNAGDARIFQAVCKLYQERDRAEQSINVIVNHLEDAEFITQY